MTNNEIGMMGRRPLTVCGLGGKSGSGAGIWIAGASGSITSSYMCVGGATSVIPDAGEADEMSRAFTG